LRSPRDVDILFDALISSIEAIKSGQLYALAVTTMTRSEALPNVPAISEFVKLNSETNAALTDPKIKARLSDIGATALFGSPSDFRKFIVEDTGSTHGKHQGGVCPR
jgi:tripartite-type tricarboxylate transporter receptor subunit TctC